MYNNSQYPPQGSAQQQQPPSQGYYPSAPGYPAQQNAQYPPQQPQQQGYPPAYPPQQYPPQQQPGYPVPQQLAYPPPQSYVPQPAAYPAPQPYPYPQAPPPQAYYANQGRAIFAQATAGAYMQQPGYVVQQPVVVQQPGYVAYPGVVYGPRMKYKHRKYKGFKGFKWKGWKHKGHKWNTYLSSIVPHIALTEIKSNMAGTKLHIVSCFALFALLVAPFAWQQTQVQRVELPVVRIQALSWNASRFAAAPRHVVRVISFGKDVSAHETATQAALRTLQTPRVEFVYENKKISEQELTRLQKITPQALDDALLELAATSDDAFAILLLCNNGDQVSTITVGKHRHAWSQACSLQDAQLTRTLQTLVQNHVYPQDGEATKKGRARIAVKYRLQFSLLKESAESPWTWDFQNLEQRFLAPVLKKLESVAQFTVEHQTLHYARIAKEIHADSSGDFHFVHAEDLKRFKSTNDFLTSSVLSDREQVLHFMAALPSQQHTPLFIKPAHGKEIDNRLATAFEIPSWGVVALLDPRSLESSSAAELQRMMGLLIAKLRTLLGLPSFVNRQRETRDLDLSIQFLPSPRDGVAQWELDIIVHSLLRRHVRASIETLQSIMQLVGDMPQMSVLDRVAQRISHALELVERMLCVADTSPSSAQCELLSAAALLPLAREAVEEADAAYYDHTMIRQLYFPQEQMLGVFAPLLAPLLLPFFFGWIREFRQLRAKRKAQKAKAE